MGRKGWTWAPAKTKSAEKVSDFEKKRVKKHADELIENILKPAHIKPPPEDREINYIADIYGKWYRNYFYFCSKYIVRSKFATAPSFESKFARLEYAGVDKFNLSYMRHTEKWFEIAHSLTLDQCLDAIENREHFIP